MPVAATDHLTERSTSGRNCLPRQSESEGIGDNCFLPAALGPGPSPEIPEAEGVAETASTVSVFRDHCSRSARPDHTRRRRGRHRDSTRRRPFDLLRSRDARGRSRTPPLCPGAFPSAGKSMARRRDRLGEAPTRIRHREAVQRVPGTEGATWLHGWSVEKR